MAVTEKPYGKPEESAQSVESPATAPEAVERRLKKNIIISIALFIAAAALFGTVRFTAGVCIGGALAYLNYRWLHRSLKSILAASAAGEAPPNAVESISKFLLRWLIILAAIGLAAWKGGSGVTVGVVVGLFSFAGAAMMEAFAQVFWALRGK